MPGPRRAEIAPTGRARSGRIASSWAGLRQAPFGRTASNRIGRVGAQSSPASPRGKTARIGRNREVCAAFRQGIFLAPGEIPDHTFHRRSPSGKSAHTGTLLPIRGNVRENGTASPGGGHGPSPAGRKLGTGKAGLASNRRPNRIKREPEKTPRARRSPATQGRVIPPGRCDSPRSGHRPSRHLAARRAARADAAPRSRGQASPRRQIQGLRQRAGRWQVA